MTEPVELLYVVVGLGASGLSAVNFLTEKGHTVLVVDEQSAPGLASKLPEGVQTAFGGIDQNLLLSASTIVISPGVDPRHSAIVAAKVAGIPVVSDVQLFVDELRVRDEKLGNQTPIVAITGSNAKSTVTTLVGEMAKASGKVVGVGGNIGTPALELLSIADLDMVVLELSSFQLEHIGRLGASVATILNISPDHLDRHGDMQGYLAQKLRIFHEAGAAVICIDDESLQVSCQQALLEKGVGGAGVITTSGIIDGGDQADLYLVKEQGVIWLCRQGKRLISADEVFIKGGHNLLNALSALALGVMVGLEMSAMLKVLGEFRGLPHRCEYVDKVANRAYFNDSKGTNIGSTIAAVDGLGAVYGERSLVLILGGLGKGQDFSELSDCVEKYVHSIYLIGADAQAIEKGLLVKPLLVRRIHHAGNMQTAFALASGSDAKAVLLSPACASFDQFKSYSDRGEQFVAMVKALTTA
ncbi:MULTISPECIES: UDP-N-acetylmuramoyl-L-alanine--D-glutamate ligase [unclassified Moraxella]|uniref:UDP-N-acetylmuramoyl-L-alanine--D-glutamate ligase n=1 Tax=unclassified Moraxella TaxID=2685852 RepID=UPI00359EE799